MIKWLSPKDEMPTEWRDERPLVAWVRPHDPDLKDMVLGCFYDVMFNRDYVFYPNGERIKSTGILIAIAEISAPENLDV